MSQLPAESAQLTMPAQERMGRLFDTHADRLYRLARRLAPSADEALDLVQETFLKAIRAPKSAPYGQTAEEAWLVRILVNIRRDQWRKEFVRRRNAPLLRQTVMANPDPERTYLVRAAVWQALDHLSPRRRAILVMYELEGLPAPAIASLLGITPITVRWHLARARRELARRIRPETGVADEHTQTPLAGGRPAPSRSSSVP